MIVPRDEFNNQRIVIEVVNGVPKIVGQWQAASEPGSLTPIIQ
ncbi:hypothetical protein [Nostoc sp.]